MSKMKEIHIKNLEEDLDKEEKVYNKVAEKRRIASNPEEEENLARQLDSISKKIEEIKQKIKKKRRIEG